MARRRPKIVKNQAVLDDIDHHADYFAGRASLAVATRFVKETDQTIKRLATMPGMGTLWNSEHPRLAEMRFFPINKFRNHLVFYFPLSGGGIEVVRVIHGAQDLDALFDDEG